MSLESLLITPQLSHSKVTPKFGILVISTHLSFGVDILEAAGKSKYQIPNIIGKQLIDFEPEILRWYTF